MDFSRYMLKMTQENQKIAMRSREVRKRVKEAIRDDAFGMKNRITFQYSQWLKGSVVLPPIHSKPLVYEDISSQLLLRACHDRDANKK